MRNQILDFLHAIDAALAERTQEGDRLDLYLLGRAALILFYGVEGTATRDVDAVQFSQPQEPLLQVAIELFGAGTAAVDTYGLYLETVGVGIPPIPAGFRDRCQPLAEGNWRVLVVQQLEVHDLASTKFNRFAPKDRDDFRRLCDKGLLQPPRLRVAVERAWMWTTEKDGNDARDRVFARLDQVVAYLEGEASDF